jgi:16S rRNA processing protein RimM
VVRPFNGPKGELMKEKYEITVGKILGAFGIKGQLKTECISDFPERFAAGNLLFVEKTAQQMQIESSLWHGHNLLLKFVGIDDRNAAEALGQSLLKITKDQLAPLPPGHYYHFQIVGLEVYEDENKLGVIKEVLTNNANDIYVVEKVSGGELLLPALKAFITEISLETGKMQVKLPPGLDKEL